MELRIAAIALVGLIVSVSGGTATPSDDASTTRPTRTIASYHRRLEDTCPSSASPYNSTTPITTKIGTGSPGPGNCVSAPDKLRMLAPGGKTDKTTGKTTCDECIFETCTETLITGPSRTKEGSGIHTYSFTVANRPAKSISHGE